MIKELPTSAKSSMTLCSDSITPGTSPDICFHFIVMREFPFNFGHITITQKLNLNGLQLFLESCFTTRHMY
jgi:hypothetical protein